MDKWYTKLVSAMFDAIPRIAAEHPKTPSEVVKMGQYNIILFPSCCVPSALIA